MSPRREQYAPESNGAQSEAVLPTFFIVGAPKAGTTSLYRYLDQHPQIHMSPIKEPSYFASELRPENFCPQFQAQMRREVEEVRRYLRGPMTEKRLGGPVVEWEDYLRLFQHARGQTAGEASASYLWSNTAAANIAERIPDAKIVMILRNPAERAYSQYRQAVSAGQVRRSFREQVRISMRSRGGRFEVLSPLLEFGLYSEQVRRYLGKFPPQNVKIYLYEHYREKPMEILGDLFRFLSVEPAFVPDLSMRFLEFPSPHFVSASYFLKRWGIWRRIKQWTPPGFHGALRTAANRRGGPTPMEPAVRKELQNYYREDILKLGGLLGRDLGAWLDGAPASGE